MKITPEEFELWLYKKQLSANKQLAGILTSMGVIIKRIPMPFEKS